MSPAQPSRFAQYAGLDLDDRDGALRVRRIGPADLSAALQAGARDFMAHPSQLFFLMLIYPLVGLFLARMAFNADVMPLIYPMVAGFAFLGPIAAVGLYEVSRRREAGVPTGLASAFAVRHAPTFGAIAMIGFLLMVLFLVWLATAMGIYRWAYGSHVPASFSGFLMDVLGSRRGLLLTISGNTAGVLFGLLAMAVSVVSLPLLVDRRVSLACALRTSFRAVGANFGTMLLWGFIVAVTLAVASLPFFIGLAVALPILGHATWHLYRRLVP